MNGLSVKLPLTYNNIQGYAMNTNYLDLAKQNLKMVVLTEPGERVMIPTFGVGLKRRLFESRKNIESVKNEIKDKILQNKQVLSIMPEFVDPEYFYVNLSVNVKLQFDGSSQYSLIELNNRLNFFFILNFSGLI